MRTALAALCLAATASLPIFAQTPYAGEERREIKALSADEIESYRTGSGMGFAKAAELNHYPGPKHVLGLAKELGLDAGQTAKTQAIYDRMNAETVRLGSRLVEQESQLDRLFADAMIDRESLRRFVAEIAGLQGEIRAAHLQAHLETRAVLTPGQVARYDGLRGYGKGAPQQDPSQHRGH